MELTLTLVLFLVGILLIVKGGDYFVDAASWMAEVSGIPKLIVGATVVSLATTLPEMLVSLMAAAQGKVDMSIGNAVGSVTANLGLIMGIALVCMPGVIRRKDYFFKGILMILAAALIMIGGFQGEIGMGLSVLLLVVFAVFLYENVVSAKRASVSDHTEADTRSKNKTDKKEIIRNFLKFFIGAAGIVIGAQLLVDNGSSLARLIGISERVIGVTVIAIGTSLPELVTTLTAIAKKQSALSVGNILGANILDLTLILPLSAVVSGKALPVASASAVLDLPACFFFCCIAVIPAMIFSRFSRRQGVLLLVLEVAYLYLTCIVK
jgi:cation:H+ antiporter